MLTKRISRGRAVAAVGALGCLLVAGSFTAEARDDTGGTGPAGQPGVEVIPDDDTDAGPLPGVSDRTGHGAGRAPALAPRQLLAPPARASVLGSQVAPSGGRVQATLEARTGRDAETVLDHYRARLARYGFTETTGEAAVPGTEAVTFTRGDRAVLLTLTEVRRGTEFGLIATLPAGSTGVAR